MAESKLTDLMEPHWWLAEVNQYGYGKLIDGPHSERAGAEQALYLFQRLGFAKVGRYACAHVTLTEVEAKPHEANEAALNDLNAIGLSALRQQGGSEHD